MQSGVGGAMLHCRDQDARHRGTILFLSVSPAAPTSDPNSLFTNTGPLSAKGFDTTPVGVGNEHANSRWVSMGWSGMHAKRVSASLSLVSHPIPKGEQC